MPSKTEEYLALAQRTANGLTRYWESWTDYLTTASRLYKYPFADQLMIYAQRPGPLSVDHKLVGKGVLVQPGCGGQVIRPAFPVPGQAVCRALGKGKVFFGFAWHFGLLLQILGYKNSGQPFLGCPPRVYNNWVIVDFEVLMMNVYFSSLSGGRT